jgi:hypothetical protein
MASDQKSMLDSVLRVYLNWWLECVTTVMDNALDDIDPDSHSPVHVVFSASIVLRQYLQKTWLWTKSY